MAKDFLPNTSVARLRRMHKKEKDPKAKRRLLACIHRKEGRTIMEIAAAINEPRSTVTDWLRRVGAGGLHDVKNKGAACKLDKRQFRSLVRDLDAGPAAAGMGRAPGPCRWSGRTSGRSSAQSTTSTPSGTW